MWISILGPLELHGPGGPLRARKQRLLLAALVSNVGRRVSVETLTACLWGDAPPTSAVKSLRWHVGQLRKALGPRDRIVGRSGGYALIADVHEVDHLTFEQLVADGRATTPRDPDTGVELLAEALSLWRGKAYEGMDDVAGLRDEASRLEKSRLDVAESYFDTQLRLGRHAVIVPDLSGYVAREPFRERFREQLMLALYRCNRQADALEVYRRGRRTLVDALGLDPGPALRRLERLIIRSDPELDMREPQLPNPTPEVATTRHPTPAQLPAPIPTFTGRRAELDELLHHVERRSGDSLPAIGTLHGMAGIGKTALAVHAAHRLKSRFPDGQLFIDLRGFTDDASPVDPATALARLLSALGVPGSQIPSDVDDRAVLYRSTLADKRVIVVLDNAKDEAQVRQLIPGHADCLVLVTSRRRLLGLDDARSVSLDVLGAAEAERLFRLVAGEGRVLSSDSGPITQITQRCGHLPLAIRIAASRLRSRPHWTAEHLAAQLSDESELLGHLHVGDRSVSTVFKVSYRELTETQRRLFRRLSLFPGTQLDVSAAAALAGVAVRESGDLLASLTDVHLLSTSGDGRYRLHDLLRTYARHSADVDDTPFEREQAVIRLYNCYTNNARAAALGLRPNRQVLPVPPPEDAIPPLRFGDADAALDWFDREEHNLYQLIDTAPGSGRPEYACLLVDALRGFGFLREPANWYELAAQGMSATADVGAEVKAAMCHNLGLSASKSGKVDEARRFYERGIRLARDVGDEARLAELYLCLAGLLWKTGEHTDVIDYCRRALALTERHGDLVRNDACHILSAVHWHKGELAQAAEYAAEAVRDSRDSGYDNLSNTLGTLVFFNIELGKLATAESLARRQWEVAQSEGSRHSQIEALSWLSRIAEYRGDVTRATNLVAQLQQLAQNSVERDDRVIAILAAARLRLPDHPQQALSMAENAHAIAADRGLRYRQVEALLYQSQAARRLLRSGQAMDSAAEAVSRAHNMAVLRGKALTILCAAQFTAHRYRRALASGTEALAVHQRTGHRLGVHDSHHWLALVYSALGEDESAARHRSAAADSRRRLEIPTGDRRTHTSGSNGGRRRGKLDKAVIAELLP